MKKISFLLFFSSLTLVATAQEKVQQKEKPSTAQEKPAPVVPDRTDVKQATPPPKPHNSARTKSTAKKVMVPREKKVKTMQKQNKDLD